MNNAGLFYCKYGKQFQNLMRQFSQPLQSFCQVVNTIENDKPPSLSDPINMNKRKETQQFLTRKLKISNEDVLSWDKKSGKMLLFNEKQILDQKIDLVMQRLECDNKTVIQLISRTPKMFNPRFQQLDLRLNFWIDEIKCGKSHLRQSANIKSIYTCKQVDILI
eukprot:TRINITY_DN8742_c0_g1_i1.p1 TRINITY_DN8742_c0_g1~~TRINITY_DN8742_c0_g1_i1.p1  ORF type:complete len:164 (+),score=11.99 TRINITY_DN8742_c0_g1_i1:261-752(+)